MRQENMQAQMQEAPTLGQAIEADVTRVQKPLDWRALVAARVMRLIMNVGGTSRQAEQISERVEEIGEAIETLGSVTSGHMYARLMDRLSFEEYQGMVNILVALDLVRESGHQLTWVGK